MRRPLLNSLLAATLVVGGLAVSTDSAVAQNAPAANATATDQDNSENKKGALSSLEGKNLNKTLTQGSTLNPEPDHWDMFWALSNQAMIRVMGVEFGAMANEMSANSSLDERIRWSTEGSLETGILMSAGDESAQHTVSRVLTLMLGIGALLGILAGIGGAVAFFNQQR